LLKLENDIFYTYDLKGRTEFSRSLIEGVEIKLCKNAPSLCKSHVHNELSLGYIVEGSTVITLSDRTIQYKAVNGVLIPPLTTHRCAPDDIEHWAYIMLFIDENYYKDFVNFSQVKKITGHQLKKLKGFIEHLLAENELDALENVLIELLLEFGEKKIKDTIGNSRDISKIIHDYIVNHVEDEVTLDKLQSIVEINKFSIIRHFKKVYMTTPAAYHLQCRVAKAKVLLSKGTNIFDVCTELKFYDQAHLIHEFKKMYGITPGNYIEQVND